MRGFRGIPAESYTIVLNITISGTLLVLSLKKNIKRVEVRFGEGAM